jgi:hypothetical protein
MSMIHVQRRAFQWIARTVVATRASRLYDVNAGAVIVVAFLKVIMRKKEVT